MSYPKTGEEVYVSLNLSNTMLTGLGKGTITREDVSVDYLKKLFMQHGVIVSAKPEYRNIMERVNSTYDLGLEIPAKLQLFQLSEQHRRLVVVNISGLQRKNGSLLPSYTEEELDRSRSSSITCRASTTTSWSRRTRSCATSLSRRFPGETARIPRAKVLNTLHHKTHHKKGRGSRREPLPFWLLVKASQTLPSADGK